MTSVSTSTLRWCLAIPLLALAGSASAGPEACLTLRDNAAIAQCANQYGPSRVPTYPRDRAVAPASGPRYAAARPEDTLLAVPVPQRSTAAPPPEPASGFAGREHYAFILNGMAISGIAGFFVLGIIAWLWRARGASVKRCPFCSARVAASAHVCKSCFRVI